MKRLLLAFVLCSFSTAAHAELDSYCTRMAAKALTECKQQAASPEDAKTCTDQRNEVRTNCFSQLSTIKSQVSFLTFINSEKYAPLGDQIVNGLENTELSEEALNRFVGDNNLYDDVFAELSRLPCVDKKDAETGYCPLVEQDAPVDIYALTATDYLVSIYNSEGSGAYNPLYTVYLLHEGKLYPLGNYNSPAVDAKKKILLSAEVKTVKEYEGKIDFYKIDIPHRKLVLIKSFATTLAPDRSGAPVYTSEDKTIDVAAGFEKRAAEYKTQMKLNLATPELGMGAE